MEVTAGLAKSNGNLPPGLWRDPLHVTCGLTACTLGSAPGPTLGNEYGRTLPFYLTLSGKVLQLITSISLLVCFHSYLLRQLILDLAFYELWVMTITCLGLYIKRARLMSIFSSACTGSLVVLPFVHFLGHAVGLISIEAEMFSTYTLIFVDHINHPCSE